MTLDNFRILKIDDWNLTFEEYKEVINPIKKTKSSKWVRVGGYYGNMKSCLEALKNYIIDTYVSIEDYEEVLEKIDKLNNCIVNCVLRCKEGEKQ